ncbi:MAG: alpha-L-fucosidase [Ignavibacteriales bacterium]|nr:alpha-L-fucosidase [Ignavibacteriales bacterium]
MKRTKYSFVLFYLIIFVQVFSSFGQELNVNSKSEISDAVIQKAVSILPHERQYEWQKNEFTAFIHFGVNTFTGREWGTGFEDPKIFHPTNLDTDQWCEAIKSAGMKLVILTVKHHDGFCLWQTRYTEHSVASSDWLNGKGDVLKDLAKSCEKYGLKLGVYLSPADLYQIENEKGLYGNGSSYSLRTIPRKVEGRPFTDGRTFQCKVDDYNEYFLNQLFELLTEYGPIHEVWFDGAHPKRKGGQTYTYYQWYDLIRNLAPEAVIFGKGPDVRWCGNEAGRTRNSEWSVIPLNGSPENWTWPDMTDDDLGSLEKIQNTIDNGGFLHWYPAETNTSIRHGWFWRDEAQYVKSAEEIVDIWYRSVGGNTVFLLNIPPNSDGLFSDRDVKVLNKVGENIAKTFSSNLIDGAKAIASSVKDKSHSAANILDGNLNSCWIPESQNENTFVEITLPEKRTFNRIVFQEQIQDYSQRISKFNIEARIENEWEIISEGTTVGYKRICRFPTITTDRIKINILDSRLSPTINNVTLHFEEITISNPIISRDKNGIVSISCPTPGPIIKYTIDGSDPTPNSDTFITTFEMKKSGTIKAVAYDTELKNHSELIVKDFDITKSKWAIHDVSSEQNDKNELAENAIDGDESTHWITEWKPEAPKHPHSISINLNEELNLKGFTYTPRKGQINGTIKSYEFFVSLNGKDWKKVVDGEFDNIKNNPVEQKVYFSKAEKASYIKLVAISEVNGNPWASAAEIGVITK